MQGKVFSRISQGLLLPLILVASPALAAPYLTLDTFSGPPGSAVTVSGGGWEDGDTVKVFFNNTSTIPVASVVPVGGMFSVDVDIPLSSPQGNLTIWGLNSQDQSASNMFYVTSLNPSIQSQGLHTPLSTITVTGSGFGKNENILLTLGSGSATAQANATGNFTSNFTLPPLPSGLYLLKGKGQSSGAEAIEYFWLDAFWPSVSPSAWYILPGSTFTLSGSGFASGETISVKDEARGRTLATFSANGEGKFSQPIVVPLDYAGATATLKVKGAASGATTELTLGFGQFWPAVTPSSWYLMPGETLTFSGGGFAPGETVTVFSGATSLATFSTNASGNFANQGGVVIPWSAGGKSLTYKLLGSASGAETSISIPTGSFYPSLVPSPYYVYPGSSLHLNASGFAPDETLVLSVNGQTKGEYQTDEHGSAAFDFLVPFSPNTYTLAILLTGENSGTSASAEVTLGKFYPSIALSSYYGMGGSSLTISGSGFAPGEPITLKYDGLTFGTATANGGGSFSYTGFTPYVPSGVKTILATGNSSGGQANAQYTQAEGFLLTTELLQLIRNFLGY